MTAVAHHSEHNQFAVDVIQDGAGTSTDMNANDVYPTAFKVAKVYAARGLLKAMAVLQDAFAAKAVEFRDVPRMGRTQLRDAVPMTLGQEFSAYAVMLEEDRSRLSEAVELVHEINLGATAIGTGLNSPAGYTESLRRHLSQITGLSLSTSCNGRLRGDRQRRHDHHGSRGRAAPAQRLRAGRPALPLKEHHAPGARVPDPGLVTALNPYVGYEAATGIAKQALATGRGVAELVLDKGLLPADTLAAVAAQPLRPEAVAGPGQAQV